MRIEQVGVDCHFREDGSLIIKRIERGGRWIAVQQGRQWTDENGRHVLVMLGQGEVRVLQLRPSTMTWALKPRRQLRAIG